MSLSSSHYSFSSPCNTYDFDSSPCGYGDYGLRSSSSSSSTLWDTPHFLDTRVGGRDNWTSLIEGRGSGVETQYLGVPWDFVVDGRVVWRENSSTPSIPPLNRVQVRSRRKIYTGRDLNLA